ncbi:MAG TPA: apolipoprotein N-acyltransferase, partial [Chitinophagales bacterium]|nr:apolipoprotein N-acyltransferase [Chitinophagales bacterium]
MHTAIPIFFAFVPLLFAERLISDSYTKYTGLKVWFALFLGLLVWNLATTWWVQKASVAGGLFANIANPILMTIPLMLMRKVRLKFGKLAGYLAFVVFWMSFEKIHLTWELTWPWLTVGNVFAAQYSWVQWYEITGVFGGTLWVLLINIWVFHAIAEYKQPLISATKKKQLIFHALGILIIIALP